MPRPSFKRRLALFSARSGCKSGDTRLGRRLWFRTLSSDMMGNAELSHPSAAKAPQIMQGEWRSPHPRVLASGGDASPRPPKPEAACTRWS
jgi:hypothetical protein